MQYIVFNITNQQDLSTFARAAFQVVSVCIYIYICICRFLDVHEQTIS